MRVSIFARPLRDTSHPAIWSLAASCSCDHPRWFRSLRTCGPIKLRCLIRARVTQALIAKSQLPRRWFVTKRSEFVTKRGFSTLRHRTGLAKTRCLRRLQWPRCTFTRGDRLAATSAFHTATVHHAGARCDFRAPWIFPREPIGRFDEKIVKGSRGKIPRDHGLDRRAQRS
jgi:hypothetical protein